MLMKGRAMIVKGKRTKKSKKPKKLTVKKGAISKKTAAKKASKKTSKRKITNKKVGKSTATKAKQKPKTKSAWKISPKEHNSMQEVYVWKRENSTFQFSEEIQSGHVLVVEKPDLSNYDPDVGVNVYEAFDVLEYEFSESVSGNPKFSDDVPEEERDRLWNLWHEKGESGLIEEGWRLDLDTWFYGPLLVEEAKYPHNPA
jgi:hypothetical protein